MVSAELGRPVAIDAHPKHAIALGAAIAAAAARAGASTAEMAAEASIVATPEEPTVSRAVTVPTEAGWLPDPSGGHEYRYWDGVAWTDNVSDGGTTSTDPMPAAVPEPATGPATEPSAAGATPARPAPPPAPRRKAKSRVPIALAAAVVVLLVVGVLVIKGGGGGGGESGTGTFKGHANIGRPFVHHIDVPAGSALLIKAIPEGPFDIILSVASDFPTIEKYHNNFGATVFGRGAQNLASDSQMSGLDVSAIKGGVFFIVNNAFKTAGGAEQAVVPAPFAVSLDILVSGGESIESDSTITGDGEVTLQLEVRKFNGPATEPDGGGFYNELLATAYDDFLTGRADIGSTRDFVKESDFTNDSDMSRFSDSFSLLDGLPQ
jgi:hypothetical protein